MVEDVEYGRMHSHKLTEGRKECEFVQRGLIENDSEIFIV